MRPDVFLSSLGIYLRATEDVAHGLVKISSLKFLKETGCLVLIGDISEGHLVHSTWTSENLKS